MTSLVVTAKPAFAAVLLEVTGAPAGPLTITRSDYNGQATVRLMPNQEPIGGSLTVFDYEAALDGTIDYAATDSASSVATASTSLGVQFPVLSCAVLPSSQASVVAVTEYGSTREFAGTVHDVIDRPDPLVTTTALRTRSGSLTVWTGSYEDGLGTVDVASSGEVLLLRQPTYRGMDMYFIVRSVSQRPVQMDTPSVRWSVEFDYLEVASPAGPLLSAAGWTFDEVTAGYASYNAVTAAFATFNALTAGP